nr:DEAD/DEAH box helicase [uncultured Cellulosilyticum sp.]
MNFKAYNLKEGLLKAIDLLGYTSPTKVQEAVLPKVLEGKDVIVKSQTGSGKTAAFAIPICEKIKWDENPVQALILTPTRELAMQVSEDFFNIGRFERMKIVSLYGKAPFHVQQKALKQKTHIVVGTPGRIVDHLERGSLDVSSVKYLVIDEADEMLRMGFIDQVESILKYLPDDRQTLLFSATIAPHIEKLCENYMKDPQLIEIESQKLTADKVWEACYKVEEEEKMQTLMDLTVVEQPESCMIFANTKDQVDRVYETLKANDYPVRRIHGGMEQKERFAVMADFRKGYFRYLVATDVAARGIDIDHVTHVINVDVPENKENYVHRIGRTGRGGRSGKSMLLVSERENYFLKEIEAYIHHAIPVCQRPRPEEVINHQEAFETKMGIPMEKVASKGEKLSQEIMKLHINAGKKTKMRPVDIVGTLCNLKGMSAADIGIINIQDISTFVEILNNKGESVYKQLQNTPIKGRLRKVSKVEIER